MLNTIIHGEKTDKPTLLIAHGLFGSGRNWGVIAKRLSDERQVVAVDMRNHGHSPWYDEHTYPAMAADLAEVIDGQWDVLGHSMGGKAAMSLALTYPDKVRRLVVADVSPVPYSHDQNQNIQYMRRVDIDTLETRKDAYDALGGLSDDLKAFFIQSLDMKERKWRMNLDALEANMPHILGFPQFDTAFGGPALFLSGADSSYVLPEYRPRIKELFPKARFAKLPDTGHWLHAEKPREFEAAVRVFLNAKGEEK